MWEYDDARALIVSPSERPYARYASDGNGTVGVVFTDGHPRETKSNLYYVCLAGRDGGEAGLSRFFGGETDGGPSFLGADGRRIALVADGPLAPTDADLIFDRTAAPDELGGNCWAWDLAFDGSGHPVVAYSTFVSREHHQYHLARHDGSVWESQVLVRDAGGSIADTTAGYNEYYYSGGMALDHSDPGTVYLSLPNDTGGWDLEQWKTSDGGLSWSRLSITDGSSAKNVRPAVPRNRPSGTEMVLWMSGRYDYYNDYGTAINLWVRSTPR